MPRQRRSTQVAPQVGDRIGAAFEHVGDLGPGVSARTAAWNRKIQRQDAADGLENYSPDEE